VGRHPTPICDSSSEKEKPDASTRNHGRSRHGPKVQRGLRADWSFRGCLETKLADERRGSWRLRLSRRRRGRRRARTRRRCGNRYGRRSRACRPPAAITRLPWAISVLAAAWRPAVAARLVCARPARLIAVAVSATRGFGGHRPLGPIAVRAPGGFLRVSAVCVWCSGAALRREIRLGRDDLGRCQSDVGVKTRRLRCFEQSGQGEDECSDDCHPARQLGDV